MKPWSGWAITYMPYNFNNPAMGPVFKQLYARQAIQMSVDQTTLSKVVFNGSAVSTYGPIPQGQESSFVSSEQKNNPYPFDAVKAKKLLTDHGWTEQGGTMVCNDPGTGANQCGAGVDKGTKFEMQVLSQSGSTVTDNMMSALQSSFAKTGIKFGIKTAPVNSVLSQAGQCTPTSRAASGSCPSSAPRAAGTSPPTRAVTRSSPPAVAPTSAATPTPRSTS